MSSIFPSRYQEKSKLQGPRPLPLKVGKEPCKIKKQPHRQPIIIHLKSPEIIHTKPQDFMVLVQELTGNGNGKPRSSKPSSSSRCGSSVNLLADDFTSCKGKPSRDDCGESQEIMDVKDDRMAVARGVFSPSMMFPSMASPVFPNHFLSSPNTYTAWLDFGPIY